jgi:thiamine kinase-like enzyme
MIFLEDSNKIKDLLRNLKINLNNFSIKPIGLGKNNRTYLVSTFEKKYLAKFYFYSSQDKRDRLNNEFNFLEYVKGIGLKNVPEPILKSESYKLGIYEFIEGRAFCSGDISEKKIIDAASFFSSINNNNYIEKAKKLNFASDAFLDFSESISQIELRISALEDALKIENKNEEAVEFTFSLKKIWFKVKDDLNKNKGFIISNKTLCVSPSDFGFHNTLISKNQLFFVDFEYAGLDDPAKFLADFFIQPEIKVSFDYMKLFSYKALEFTNNKELIYQRALMLLPMFQVKWCCIMMNEFLPETAKRRLFSNPKLDLEKSKFQQLQKAKKLLLDI